MGDQADSTLDILIRILAQTQGADQVQAALDKTKDATADVGHATDELSEKTKDNAKHTEHAALSHRDLHKILHTIARESGPEMGFALAAGAALATGSISVLVMAGKELIEVIHKQREKAAELRAEQAQIQTSVWDAQREAA